MSTVGPGMRVRLHFTLSLEDGAVIDSTRTREPAEFEVGDGNLLPGFEAALFGLGVGDTKLVVLAPRDAFGERLIGNVRELPASAFADMQVEPGTIVSFAEPSGSELPGVVEAINGDRVRVDFNHPLAGRNIRFEVQILAVETAGDTA